MKSGSVAAVSAGLALSFADSVVGQALGQSAKRAASQLGVPDERQFQSTFYLVRESFEPYLNTVFQVQPVGASSVDMNLVEVADPNLARRQKHPSLQIRTNSFSLLFYSPRKSSLTQSLYTMKHDALGSFAVFIVPVYMSRKGQYYEAVFSRLI